MNDLYTNVLYRHCCNSLNKVIIFFLELDWMIYIFWYLIIFLSETMKQPLKIFKNQGWKKTQKLIWISDQLLAYISIQATIHLLLNVCLVLQLFQHFTTLMGNLFQYLIIISIEHLFLSQNQIWSRKFKFFF